MGRKQVFFEIHDIPQSCHNTVLNLIHEWNLLDNDISLNKKIRNVVYMSLTNL